MIRYSEYTHSATILRVVVWEVYIKYTEWSVSQTIPHSTKRVNPLSEFVLALIPRLSRGEKEGLGSYVLLAG